ncbi:hypothetical protein AAGS61_17745 [Lysinibacillus sp. KU-BSD001]|uniref:hypothetical protein n=1 Tax=Lysinibacillus sp. KU-BSD001 TaxID=3141328 RepID=UPI0036E660D2
MEKVIDYILQHQSATTCFVEQRTYFNCTPASERLIEYTALDVVNVNCTFIVSLINEKKGLLFRESLASVDLLGFEFGQVLLVTTEVHQAYAFVQEFRQKIGYITNIRKHLKQLHDGE